MTTTTTTCLCELDVLLQGQLVGLQLLTAVTHQQLKDLILVHLAQNDILPKGDL
jgi:hypothetical protein